MITRNADLLIVEGPIALPQGENRSVQERLRVEIDTTSGVICDVGPPCGNGDLVLDDTYLILPGLIDAHVHAREDTTGTESYKEDFASASEAALHGGVTAIAEMPNNPRPPLDDDSYRAKRRLARASAAVDVLLFAGVGPRTRPLSFPVPYKAYMGPSVGDLYFRDDESLRETLARYRGKRVAFHAESPAILERCREAPTHAEQRPPHAEVEAIRTAIEFCSAFAIDVHICHLSTAEGLEVIRTARKRGIHVSCEVIPQHLYYDQDNLSVFAHPGFLQCNPPIRSRLDRIALLEAFCAGEIDFFATDHAPHSYEENERGISGMPHLDTYGPFLFWLHAEGAAWSTLIDACCVRPGRFFNDYLPDLRGRIEAGWLGNLTVLVRKPVTIRRSTLRTKAGWSPFQGVTFPGRVSHTIIRGKIYPQDLED